MKSYETYAELELISLDQEISPLYPPASPTLWQRFITLLGTGSQALLHYCVGSSEPRVWQKRDRHGNLYYQVYDPITGLAATLGSEQEVRGWLDNRFSR